MTAILARFDKNEDGKLEQSEVPDKVWTRISKADKDDDGHVSKPELQATMKKNRKHKPPHARRSEQKDSGAGSSPPPARRGPSDNERSRGRVGRGGSPPDADRIFQRFDDDENERLSEDELPGFLWRRLADADQDGDKQISKEELQQAHIRMPRRGPRPDQNRGNRHQRRGGDSNAGKQSRADAHAHQPSGESGEKASESTNETESPTTEPSG